MRVQIHLRAGHGTGKLLATIGRETAGQLVGNVLGVIVGDPHPRIIRGAGTEPTFRFHADATSEPARFGPLSSAKHQHWAVTVGFGSVPFSGAYPASTDSSELLREFFGVQMRISLQH